MKILWLINIPLPEASQLLNQPLSPFGGWILSASKYLSMQGNVELFITFPTKKLTKYSSIKGQNILYYPFMLEHDSNIKRINCYNYFIKLLQDLKPDLVHIYGTEMEHTLLMVNACKEMEVKVVISIQGLLSIIAKHMYSGLPYFAIYAKTLRNIIRGDNVSGLKNIFYKRGQGEIESINNTKYIIGRTTWDRVCVMQINPGANYYHCNETLREEFYKHEWQLKECEKYTIFLSQGQYPIKGLHFLIEALPIILKNFPETKVYISGKNIVSPSSIKDKMLMTYYGKYNKGLIKKYDLNNNIIFTGLLDEKLMCQRFINSHVFVSPSTVENESNSLSEAKLLGVPSVASYVGGVIDRIDHGFDGFLYQHDAPYMLAHYVCEIFANDQLALKLSANARQRALKTHDKVTNTNRLLQIYNEILNAN